MEEQKIKSLQFVTGNRSNIRNTTMFSDPNHDNIWKHLEVLLLVQFLFNFQVDFMAQSFLTNDFLWPSLPTIWKDYLRFIKALISFLTIFLLLYGAENYTDNNLCLLYFHTVCLAKIS